MLQACLNGGRSKSEYASIPVTAAELAAQAVAVRDAGAQELHVHPRSPQGNETLEPNYVGQCLSAIRAAVPEMPVGVGTGAWIEPKFRARLENVKQWQVLPDYASVNLNEEDAPETMDILLSKGIGIEAGIWSRQDASRFVAIPQSRRCLRILVEMTSDDPNTAMEEYQAVMSILEEHGNRLPILLHGEGGSVWAMVREAAKRGFSTRVGFEDGVHLPDGTPAQDNAAIVRAAVVLSK